MQNFFVYDSQVQGEKIYIEGTDVNHIVHVLRMKVGEEVSVHDNVNRKYFCAAFRNWRKNRLCFRL